MKSVISFNKTIFFWLCSAFLISLPTRGGAYPIILYRMFAGTAAPLFDASPEQPWLVATLESVDSKTVSLTLTAPKLTGLEYVSIWDFNFNPGKSLRDLSYAFVGSDDPTGPIDPADPQPINRDSAEPLTPGVTFAPDSFHPAGYPGFDIQFVFKPGAFDSTKSYQWTFSLTTGLSPLDFYYWTESSDPERRIPSAALIENTGSDHKGYAWITPDASSTLSLLGLALLGLHCFRGKRA